jgi:hypothetical protein
MDNSVFLDLARIAKNLDKRGLYAQSDKLNEIIRLSAKEMDKDNLVDKIMNLLAKENIKCPDCGGDMDMEDGLCNCGDENCDCTIDMKDEIDDFLHRMGIGNIDCPECGGTLEMKGMHCVCKNGNCKCKQKVASTLLADLFDNSKFDKKFSYNRTAGREDHEFSMARKQLGAAHDAIERIMEKLGTEEGEMMAWVQAYITMASDYLQSVANNAEFSDDFDLSDNDEDYGSVEEVDPDEMHDNEKFASTGKKTNKRLNKPFRTPGGPKKFSVYVKNKKGNIIKVNFGDPERSIKRDNPERRKNFRARHNCDSDPRAKDRTTAKYWSCKFWSNPSVSSLLKGKKK